MKKLYSIVFLSVMSIAQASNQPNQGNLPEDFKFGDDVRHDGNRTSFMSQWTNYLSSKKSESDNDDDLSKPHPAINIPATAYTLINTSTNNQDVTTQRDTTGNNIISGNKPSQK